MGIQNSCKHILEIFQKLEKHLKNNFKYILVDEFQDTNFIQNLWLNLITSDHKNYLCVLGMMTNLSIAGGVPKLRIY